MTQSLASHVNTRMLVAAPSEGLMAELDSVLRDAGIALKLTLGVDPEMISTALESQTVDLLVLTHEATAARAQLSTLRDIAPDTPIIVLASAAMQAADRTQALQLGASDCLMHSDANQFVQVVRRELGNVARNQQLQHTLRALAEAEQRCEQLLQGSRAAIAYIHEGMHIQANAGYLSLFGYNDVEQLGGVSLIDLLTANSAEALKKQLKRMRSGTQETHFDFSGYHQGGAPIAGTMHLAHSQYEGESCLQVTVRLRSDAVAATSDAIAAPTDAAPTPPQTLDPEADLASFLQLADTQAVAAGHTRFILVADLQAFGELQRTNGIMAANQVADELWSIAQANLVEWPLARLSTHQFVLALDVSAPQEVQQLGEALIDRAHHTLERLCPAPRNGWAVRAVALDSDHDGGAEAAMNQALEALRSSAGGGAGKTVVITATQTSGAPQDTAERQTILGHINDAIEGEQFVLVFQPIVSLRGEAEEYYEVWLRMRDHNGELIEPVRLLQTAIAHNVAGTIDRWVILQTIKQLSAHRAAGNVTRLTVNLSGNSLHDADFLDWLATALKAARLPSDAIMLQISESDAVADVDTAQHFLERLRNMHCRAALSDFGLSEAPLEILKRLPVDIVKLDPSLMEHADSNNARRDAVLEVLRQLQGAGKLTVIPLLENTHVLSMLWQAGANYVQSTDLQEANTAMDYDFGEDED